MTGLLQMVLLSLPSPLLPSPPLQLAVSKLESVDEQLLALKDLQKGILAIQQEVRARLSAAGVSNFRNTSLLLSRPPPPPPLPSPLVSEAQEETRESRSATAEGGTAGDRQGGHRWVPADHQCTHPH